MKKKETVSLPAVGAGSLLAAFAVLCLTVFALLSLSTVQAENRLAEVTIQAVSDYYAADLQAEEIYARLRAGELPAGVVQQDNRYTYRCPISEHQYLLVEVARQNTDWQVICWQTVSREPEAEPETLPVWNGGTD